MTQLQHGKTLDLSYQESLLLDGRPQVKACHARFCIMLGHDSGDAETLCGSLCFATKTA